jgi:hypothetical protein
MEKTKEEVIDSMLKMAQNSVWESELKENYYWEKTRELRTAGKEKEAAQMELKAGAEKQNRKETYESWLNFLKRQTTPVA